MIEPKYKKDEENKYFEIYRQSNPFEYAKIILKEIKRPQHHFITNCLSFKFGQLITNNDDYLALFTPNQLKEKRLLETRIFGDSLFYATLSVLGLFTNLYYSYQINNIIVKIESEKIVEEQFLFAKLFEFLSVLLETISNVYTISAVCKLCTQKLSYCIIALSLSFVFSAISGILFIQHEIIFLNQSILTIMLYYLGGLIGNLFNFYYYAILYNNMEEWVKNYTLQTQPSSLPVTNQVITNKYESDI